MESKQVGRLTSAEGTQVDRYVHDVNREGSIKQNPDRSDCRSKHDSVSVVNFESEVQDVGKSRIVTRFLSSVKSEDLNECLRKPERRVSTGSSPQRPTLRKKSRFANAVRELVHRSKTRRTKQISENSQHSSEIDHRSETSKSVSTRMDVKELTGKSYNERTSGDDIDLTIAGKGLGFSSGIPMNRKITPDDLAKTGTDPDILTEQTDRKRLNKMVSTQSVAAQSDGEKRRNRRRPREGHGEKVEKMEDPIILNSTSRKMASTEKDIPQSISTDSGIGSPTEVIYNTHSAEKAVEETILEHAESELAADHHLARSIGHDHSQGRSPGGDSPASPLPQSVTNDTSNYRVISLPDRLQPSLTPPGRTGENDSELPRLTCGEVDKSDAGQHTPTPDPARLDRSAATNLYSSCVLDFDGGNDEFLSRANICENLEEKVTLPDSNLGQIKPRLRSSSSLEEEETEAALASRRHLFDSLQRGISIDSIPISASHDTLAEFTVSNIIRTLISNQNKKRILETEESNLSIEDKLSSQNSLEDSDTEIHLDSDTREDTDKTVPDKVAPEKPIRRKLTFRNVSLQDVIALSDSPNTDRKLKGILKSTSVPALSSSKDSFTERLPDVNGTVKLELPNLELPTSRSVSFNKTHIKNTFSYYNDAFEGEIITEPSKRPSLADVVSQIMRQGAIVDIDEDNSHPYGRDTSLTDLITGKRRDSYKMDAGKMIVWLVLAIMIVSLAGGIIFMSETYNMNHKDDDVVVAPVETTTLTNHLR
nr:hypothetical protein BgiMline_030933 [Biomphalaria glabrata]